MPVGFEVTNERPTQSAKNAGLRREEIATDSVSQSVRSEPGMTKSLSSSTAIDVRRRIAPAKHTREFSIHLTRWNRLQEAKGGRQTKYQERASSPTYVYGDHALNHLDGTSRGREHVGPSLSFAFSRFSHRWSCLRLPFLSLIALLKRP